MRARVVYAANDLDLDSITYEDLADPEWKGRICIRSGQHPYNTALFSAFMAHHDAADTEAWLTGLTDDLARTAGSADRHGAPALLGAGRHLAVATP